MVRSPNSCAPWFVRLIHVHHSGRTISRAFFFVDLSLAVRPQQLLTVFFSISVIIGTVDYHDLPPKDLVINIGIAVIFITMTIRADGCSTTQYSVTLLIL